jgi:opacity protein-like surface antigen
MTSPMRIAEAAAVAVALLIGDAESSWAQPGGSAWTPEVSAAAGLGHVFRYRDETYGDEPNLSGAVILRHARGLAFEIEANRTIGLTAGPAPCGVLIDGVPATCTGSAREGALAATSLSFNLHYLFTGRRVQPYLLGGLGVLRTRMVSSITTVRDGAATQTEQEDSATGLGPDIGAGLRIPLGTRLTIAPEIRWLEAASLSRHNLAVTRASVRVSFAP